IRFITSSSGRTDSHGGGNPRGVPKWGMGQVAVTLNGRTYRLRCEDGEEQRLLALAEYVRQKVDGLVREFGQIGEDRLLFMASLLLSDELFDCREQLLQAGRPSDYRDVSRDPPGRARTSASRSVDVACLAVARTVNGLQSTRKSPKR